jgi:Flp pilus assembly protein TadG
VGSGWGQRLRDDDKGQSLVEVALVLPLLLLIVLGMVDVGRIYALKVAVTNAAREAAIYAARDPDATVNGICQRARDALGAGPATDPCGAGPGATLRISCSREGQSCDAVGVRGADVTVKVRYTTSLITGYLAGRALPLAPVLSATASAPGLSP